MPDIKFTCQHCQQEIEAPQSYAGQHVECPGCEAVILVPKPAAKPPAAKRRKRQISVQRSSSGTTTSHTGTSTSHAEVQGTTSSPRPGRPQEFILTDIRMPFGNMIVFILKWMLASIPAMLLLYAITFLILFLIMSLFGGAAMIFGK